MTPARGVIHWKGNFLAMPTYVYETIPKSGKPVKRYEIRHGINESPLAKHPDTGEAIRRVIASGASILTSRPTAAPSRGGGCGCGAGGCGC